ncbi:TniQ family protein [Oscillospiraceae bacterium 44-5]
MISYFPAISPDELVYSWFCRYYVHSGFFSSKSAMQELYCKRSDNPSKEFIGNLNPGAMEQVAKMYPLDKLVLEHTMYPQYARFIPLEQKKTALYRLGHDNRDAHHLFCVLSRYEREQYLQLCPLCVNEDRETYGEAYWHRKHQIRNMGICTKHRCRLVESCVPAKSEQDFVFCPAEHYTGCDKVIVEEDPQMIQFASYLESIFETPMDFENDTPISSVLYHGMYQTKYLKPSGRSRYAKMLADDLNVFYRGMGLYNVASMYQIQRVRLSPKLCKPARRCKIGIPHWRFHYGKKRTQSGKASPASKDPRVIAAEQCQQHGGHRNNIGIHGRRIGRRVVRGT